MNVLNLGDSFSDIGSERLESYLDFALRPLGLDPDNHATGASYPHIREAFFEGNHHKSLGRSIQDVYDDPQLDNDYVSFRQSYEYCIRHQFMTRNYDVVTLFHAHNARNNLDAPVSRAIPFKVFATNRRFVLLDAGDISGMPDRLNVQIGGGDKLHGWIGQIEKSPTGRFYRLASHDFPFKPFKNFNGIITTYDMTTYKGSMSFLIDYIRYIDDLFWDGSVDIVLATVPSDYHQGAFDPRMSAVNAQVHELVAEKSTKLFNLYSAMNITSQSDHDQIFQGDGKHFFTIEERRDIAAPIFSTFWQSQYP